MEDVSLTVDQLAALACLPRHKQLDLLKAVATSRYLLWWDAEKHQWVLKPVE